MASTLSNIPDKWGYNTKTKKLSMIFKDGLKTYLVSERARIITESGFRMGVCDSGKTYVLLENAR